MMGKLEDLLWGLSNPGGRRIIGAAFSAVLAGMGFGALVLSEREEYRTLGAATAITGMAAAAYCIYGLKTKYR